MKVTRVTKRKKNREYLYLTPLNCPQTPPCKSISYEQILEQTINQICVQLPQAVSKLNIPSPEGLKSQLQGEIIHKENIIDQLPTLIEQGILDPETAQIRSYKLRTEIAQIQTKIAQLPPVNLKAIASAVSIPQFWLDLSETERRFYFREFISKILITYPSPDQNENWEIKLIFIF
jgi:hypothetical protein